MLTYPTLADLNAADDFDLLDYWVRVLPKPQTDAERTFARRLRTRHAAVAGQTLREQAPDVAAQFERVLEKLRKVAGC